MSKALPKKLLGLAVGDALEPGLTSVKDDVEIGSNACSYENCGARNLMAMVNRNDLNNRHL